MLIGPFAMRMLTHFVDPGEVMTVDAAAKYMVELLERSGELRQDDAALHLQLRLAKNSFTAIATEI